jgi:thiamine biosynthesis protein ThiS
MNLIINGQPHQSGAPTVSDLLGELQLDVARVAVEYNHAILPREAFAATLLNENDRLEIVQFVGGG